MLQITLVRRLLEDAATISTNARPFVKKLAQINEALCEILCHNICCLIQSMYELNLKPKFWKEVA